MRKRKRLIAILLVFVMVCGLAGNNLAPVYRAEGADLVDGYFKYKILSDGTASIIGYTGSDTDVHIPATVGGDNKIPVTEFDDNVFQNNTIVELVDFSSSQIKTVGSKTFYGCSKLQKVILPETLQGISNKMFYNCRALKEVVIPEGIKTIAAGAFSGCSALEYITIPDSVTTMKSASSYTSADCTFYKCTGLKEVTIGDGLTAIEYNTFYGCTSLQTVTLGKSITSIGKSAFANCSSLEEIVIPDACLTIGETAFSGCEKLAHVNLGNGLQTLEKGAFVECSSLQTIVFPDSLTTLQTPSGVANYTFGECTSLTEIVFGNGITNIPKNTFNGATALTTLYIGGNITAIGTAAFANCESLTDVYMLNVNCPTVEGNTFDGYPDTFKIHLLEEAVTSDSYSLYPKDTYDKTGMECTVAFDSMRVEDDTVEKTALINSFVSPIVSPTKDGYSFAGWYRDEECTGEAVDFSRERITEDVTYYAKWELNSYKLIFDLMYGTNEEKEYKVVTYSEPVGELPVPVRENYKFLGWYQGQSGAGECYTEESIMPGKDTTLYALWEQVVTVNLEKTEVYLQTSDKTQLKYTIAPLDAYDKTVKWESSDESVVTVDNLGNVTAIKKGTAQITVTTVSNKTATCDVTVTIKPSITVNKSLISGYEKETFQLSASVIGESKEVKWTSSDPAIATVDQNGKVTAKAIGSTSINATANGVTASCKIQVLALGISLDKSSVTVYTQGSTKATIHATVSGRDHAVKWESSNPAVATVSSVGLVVGKKAGTAYITAKANGLTARCKVTVKKPTLTVTKNKITVKRKKTKKISYKLKPSGKVTFTVQNPKIVKVTQKGKVKGLKKGKTKVTLTAYGLKKTVTIVVKK